MPFSQEDLEELAALGLRPCPPDHWVYRQGTVFVIPDQGNEPKQPVVHYRLGPTLLACRTPGASPHTHFPASEDRLDVTCRSCLRITPATIERVRALVADLPEQHLSGGDNHRDHD